MQNWRWLWIALSLILILFYATPQNFELKDSVVIKDSQEDIFAFLVNLESWDDWFPLVGADYQFKGIQGVVGSSMTWKSPDLGETTITLTELEEPNFITLAMSIGDKEHLEETIHSFKLNRAPEGIRLDWSARSHSMTLWRRIYLRFAKEKLKRNFQPNFDKLKEILEKS